MSVSTAIPMAVKQVLENAGHPAVRHLCVEETEQGIVISGNVTCYYHKQLAQELLLPIIGDRKLLNQVSVVAD